MRFFVVFLLIIKMTILISFLSCGGPENRSTHRFPDFVVSEYDNRLGEIKFKLKYISQVTAINCKYWVDKREKNNNIEVKYYLFQFNPIRKLDKGTGYIVSDALVIIIGNENEMGEIVRLSSLETQFFSCKEVLELSTSPKDAEVIFILKSSSVRAVPSEKFGKNDEDPFFGRPKEQ